MVMPHLLLQKPFASSKVNCEVLSRRLHAWKAGDLDRLLCKGRVIQKHARHVTRNPKEDILASSFLKMMLAGNTNAALRLLTKEGCGSVLLLDQVPDPSNPSVGTVLDALKAKHPPPQPVNQQALLTNTDLAPETHPIFSDSIRSSTSSGVQRYDAVGQLVPPVSMPQPGGASAPASNLPQPRSAMPWHSWHDASAPSMWTQRDYLPSQPAI